MRQNHGFKLLLHQPLALFVNNPFYAANVGQKSVRHDAHAWLRHGVQLRYFLNLPNYYNLMVKTANTCNWFWLAFAPFRKETLAPFLGWSGLLCDF
jgi:hypothetical protein